MRIGSPFAMIGMDFVNVPRTKLIPIMRLRPFVAQSPSSDSARSGLFGANVTFVRSRRTNVTFAPFGKRFPSSILTLSRSISSKRANNVKIGATTSRSARQRQDRRGNVTIDAGCGRSDPDRAPPLGDHAHIQLLRGVFLRLSA